jgi:hypothetical protein
VTRKPGAISGRSLDPKRTRRNHAKATIITGDRLLPPIREDAQGRISVKPLPRITSGATDGSETAATVNARLNTLIDYLKEAGYME